MKNLIVGTAVTASFLFLAVGLFAAQPVDCPNSVGNVPANVLADMGLAGMQTISDAQGCEVRAKGFRYAFSLSFATGGALDWDFAGPTTGSAFVYSSSIGTTSFSWGFAYAGAN